MLERKHAGKGDRAADAVAADKDEVCYEMLLSLIEDPRIEVRASDKAAEEIKCLLAGKWFRGDDGIADIYAKKLFGSAVSEWHPHAVECYAAIYDARYNDYADHDARRRAKMVRSALKAAALAACAAALWLAASRRK